MRSFDNIHMNIYLSIPLYSLLYKKYNAIIYLKDLCYYFLSAPQK